MVYRDHPVIITRQTSRKSTYYLPITQLPNYLPVIAGIIWGMISVGGNNR
jgi:hypothetical protein